MNDLSPADSSHVTDERGRLNQQPTGGAADAADPARSMHGRLFVTLRDKQLSGIRLGMRRSTRVIAGMDVLDVMEGQHRHRPRRRQC